MSTIIMSKCWSLQMPPTPKSVLISLADNANDHGVCWPSIPTIALRTCFSERAVQGAIKWLEKHGVLKADRSNGRHTTYVVTPESYTQPPQEVHPRSKCTGAGDAPTPAGAAPLPPQEVRQPPQEVPSNRKEPSKEPSMNRQGASKATRLAADWALPKKYGDWALQEFPLWDAEYVRKVAMMFRNHWVAKSGKDAAKLDWFATWQNWCLKEPTDPHGKSKAAGEVPSEWWASSAGIEAKGRDLGLVPNEQEKKIFAYYRDRVFAAAGSGPWNDKSRS